MNLFRLLRMNPAEVTTRAQQAFSKRWSKPPVCRLNPPTPLLLPALPRSTHSRQPKKSAAIASICWATPISISARP